MSSGPQLYELATGGRLVLLLSDYVRVLESGDPALWGEAVREVALESLFTLRSADAMEVQPLEGYLHHPVTGELCLYYAGADSDHPDARFYMVDDTGSR